MHVRDGRAALLRQASGHPASYIAKLCGSTPEMVYGWETGTLQPSTQQALAWLDALHTGQSAAEKVSKATAGHD